MATAGTVYEKRNSPPRWTKNFLNRSSPERAPRSPEASSERESVFFFPPPPPPPRTMLKHLWLTLNSKLVFSLFLLVPLLGHILPRFPKPSDITSCWLDEVPRHPYVPWLGTMPSRDSHQLWVPSPGCLIMVWPACGSLCFMMLFNFSFSAAL